VGSCALLLHSLQGPSGWSDRTAALVQFNPASIYPLKRRVKNGYACFAFGLAWGHLAKLDLEFTGSVDGSLRIPILGHGARNLRVLGNSRCGNQSQPAFPSRYSTPSIIQYLASAM
jgi:hypothetical protein